MLHKQQVETNSEMLQMMLIDVAHAMECIFVLSVELIQQITPQIDRYTS
jgi:hypothetical protein